MNEEILIALGDLTNGALNYYQTPRVVMTKRDIIETYIDRLQQENQKYKEVIDKLKEWINIVQQNKDNKHLEPFISTDELDELVDILKEVE